MRTTICSKACTTQDAAFIAAQKKHLGPLFSAILIVHILPAMHGNAQEVASDSIRTAQPDSAVNSVFLYRNTAASTDLGPPSRSTEIFTEMRVNLGEKGNALPENWVSSCAGSILLVNKFKSCINPGESVLELQLSGRDVFSNCFNTYRDLSGTHEDIRYSRQEKGVSYLIAETAADISRIRPTLHNSARTTDTGYLSDRTATFRSPDRNINIAMIDSGINFQTGAGPQINVKCSLDFTTPNATHTATPCSVKNDHGGNSEHGTIVALVASGRYVAPGSDVPSGDGYCGANINGALPGAGIFDLKACDGKLCENDAVFRAFDWIVSHNRDSANESNRIHVVNMSFAQYINDPKGESLLATHTARMIEQAGVVAVAGFGNAGGVGPKAGSTCVAPPGAAANVITVAAAKDNTERPERSQYKMIAAETLCGQSGKPNVIAPMHYSIQIPLRNATAQCLPPNTEAGSSFSAAHVSGLLANVLSYFPDTKRAWAAAVLPRAINEAAFSGLDRTTWCASFDTCGSSELLDNDSCTTGRQSEWSPLYGHGLVDANAIYDTLENLWCVQNPDDPSCDIRR